MRPLQLTSISGLQAGVLPATTTAQQFDISAIMNLMLIMVILSINLMMKMITLKIQRQAGTGAIISYIATIAIKNLPIMVEKLKYSYAPNSNMFGLQQ